MFCFHFVCLPLTIAGSSRQREFHPKPLTEPYVTVSRHTALLILIYKYKLILFQVGKLYFKLANPFAPLPLQELHHYYELVRHLTLHW